MEFAIPAYGWLALPIILIFLLEIRGIKLRQKELQQLAEPLLLGRLITEEQRWQRRLRHIMPLLGMLFLVVALMRPQWGVIEEVHPTVGLDIVIALDVSRSMLADDLLPTRLAVAKKSVLQILDSSSEDRIGLLAFAGSAFLVSPLTTDHAIIRQMLDELGPDSIPKGGSSLSAALTEAERAFRGTSPGGRLLLLVSDGEDHTGEIAPALERLRRSGVTVVAALAGTSEGGLIPLPEGNFVKDRDGAAVKSHARLATLKMLNPDAVTLNVSGTTLKQMLDRARAGSQESASQQRRRKLADRFQYPLAMAFLLFILQLLPYRGGDGRLYVLSK